MFCFISVIDKIAAQVPAISIRRRFLSPKKQRKELDGSKISAPFLHFIILGPMFFAFCFQVWELMRLFVGAKSIKYLLSFFSWYLMTLVNNPCPCGVRR